MSAPVSGPSPAISNPFHHGLNNRGGHSIHRTRVHGLSAPGPRTSSNALRSRDEPQSEPHPSLPVRVYASQPQSEPASEPTLAFRPPPPLPSAFESVCSGGFGSMRGYGAQVQGSPPKSRPMPKPPAPAATGSGGLDICFVMDCTGSMQPWIEASKQTIKEMIRALPAEEKHKRVAFVGYRDFGDGPAETIGFTEHVEDVVRFIDGQRAFGGGDIAEDVAGGLAEALTQTWVSQTRTLVLIADAPCHGAKYQPSANASDDYRRGDPTGLSMTRLLQMCRLSGIDFTFVQLTSETHKMQEELRKIYESAAGSQNINKFELRDLRQIIQEAGGMAAMGDGRAVHVNQMLSAAITPTIQASYQNQQTGYQAYAPSVVASYRTMQEPQQEPPPTGAALSPSLS